MRFKKLRLRKTTCLAIGVAGAVVALVTGALMVAGFGRVMYGQTATLAVNGAMLLLFATREKGDENRGRRTRILLLFFALIVANLQLPPLEIFEVLVLPMFALLYRQKGDGPFIVAAFVAEGALAAVRVLSITSVLGSRPLVVVGAVMMATAAVRGVLMLRMRHNAKALGEEGEPEVHTLR